MIPLGAIKFLWQHHQSHEPTTTQTATQQLDELEHRLIGHVTKAADLHRLGKAIRQLGKSVKADDLLPADAHSHRRHNLLQTITDIRRHIRDSHAHANSANTDADAPSEGATEVQADPYEPITRADPTEGTEAINVHAELMPPTHTIRMHSLSEAVVWHRRYGHLQHNVINRTIKHVSGLRRHKQPALCECCVRSKMTKPPEPKYRAERPNADTPLGEVSMDTIEYSISGTDTIEGANGARYAQVFVDGHTRHKYVRVHHEAQK